MSEPSAASSLRPCFTLFADAEDDQAGLPRRLDYWSRTPEASAPGWPAWIELAELRLFRARETIARVAYLSLPPEWVFVVVFPTQRHSELICDGVQRGSGNIIVQSPGERVHQRTTGPGGSGAQVREHDCRAERGSSAFPPFSQIRRPLPADLRLLHAKRCGLQRPS
jgi:hypothetical protein